MRNLAVAVAVVGLAAAAPTASSGRTYLDHFQTLSTLATAVPASGAAAGDQNPYGVAVVPRSVGKLVKGHVLVSNFDGASNHQGTGSSIVDISPSGGAHVFAVVPRPTATKAVGLTTALVALRSGYVVVGSLPAPGGMSSAMKAGALTILDWNGHVAMTIKGGDIKGPWDMTAVDHGSNVVLFVTNVLNGTVKAGGKVVKKGTVVRIVLSIQNHHVSVVSNRVIATGFGEHTDPNALVVGPTGVGLGPNGTLYIADSNGSRIAAVANAMTRTSVLGGGGKTVSSGGSLNDPLGLAIAPGGDIITTNGSDGNAVETTPSGHQAVTKTLIINGGGDLFGLAIAPHQGGIYLVDDAGSGTAANSLQLLH